MAGAHAGDEEQGRRGRGEIPLDVPAIVTAYGDGVSMRRLAAEHGVAYATVRSRLVAAGAALRPKGGQWRKGQSASAGDSDEQS